MGKKRSRKKENKTASNTNPSEPSNTPIKKLSPTIIDVPNNNHLEIKPTNIPMVVKHTTPKSSEKKSGEIAVDSSKKKKKKKKRQKEKADQADGPTQVKKLKLDESLVEHHIETAQESLTTDSKVESKKETKKKTTKKLNEETNLSNDKVHDIKTMDELKSYLVNASSTFSELIRSLLQENESLKVASEQLENELKECQTSAQNIKEVEQKMISCHICMDVFSNPQILECGCIHAWLCKQEGTGDCPSCRNVCRNNPIPNRYAEYHVEQIVLKMSDPRKTEVLERIKEEKEEYLKKKDPWHPWKRPVQYIIDHDDGVTRCGTCGWEIEDGVCENCNARYPDLDQGGDLEENDDYPDDHEDSMDTEDEHFVVDDDYVEYESDASQRPRNRNEDDFQDSSSDSGQVVSVRNNVIDVSDESSDSDVEVTRVSSNRTPIQDLSDEEQESSRREHSDKASIPDFSENSSEDDEYSNSDRNEMVEFSAEEDNYEDSSSD
ncbi:E3 ubiquitin ligase [Boothiomyces sp. JEL0838]|nr:E3 ubiquitin ligase [Boothiomyces sp. JEL0838]